jgi:hypothetical protein
MGEKACGSVLRMQWRIIGAKVSGRSRDRTVEAWGTDIVRESTLPSVGAHEPSKPQV